jgi:hypothetical protein
MIPSRFAVAAVLLGLASQALAHGDDENAGMHMGEGESPEAPKLHELPDYYSFPSYAGLGTHGKMMLAHIVLMVLAWFFVLPIGKSVQRPS